jgi:hypothetical protein
MGTIKQWLHGLGAALIGAVATAVPLALADPHDFDFSRHGLIDFARIIGFPAILAVAAYLKQSPLPSASSTVTATVTKTVSTTPDAK